MLFSLGDDDPTSKRFTGNDPASKRFPAEKSHVLLRKACDSIEFPGMSSQEPSLPTEKKDRLLCPSPDGSSGGVALNNANNENVSTSGKLARMETRRRNAFLANVSTSGHREVLVFGESGQKRFDVWSSVAKRFHVGKNTQNQ